MECDVITAILHGAQRTCEEDELRRQREHDCPAVPLARIPRWQALGALLEDKRKTPRATAGQGVIAHGA